MCKVEWPQPHFSETNLSPGGWQWLRHCRCACGLLGWPIWVELWGRHHLPTIYSEVLPTSCDHLDIMWLYTCTVSTSWWNKNDCFLKWSKTEKEINILLGLSQEIITQHMNYIIKCFHQFLACPWQACSNCGSWCAWRSCYGENTLFHTHRKCTPPPCDVRVSAPLGNVYFWASSSTPDTQTALQPVDMTAHAS